MDCLGSGEIVWNLKRLIRDAYPQGMPLRYLQPQYSKYFQKQLPPPNSIAPGCSDWFQVFDKSDHFKKWFRRDRRKNVIKALPVPERDLKAYFRLNRYTQFISVRVGAKADGWSGLSDTEEDSDGSDEESQLVAEAMGGNSSISITAVVKNIKIETEDYPKGPMPMALMTQTQLPKVKKAPSSSSSSSTTSSTNEYSDSDATEESEDDVDVDTDTGDHSYCRVVSSTGSESQSQSSPSPLPLPKKLKLESEIADAPDTQTQSQTQTLMCRIPLDKLRSDREAAQIPKSRPERSGLAKSKDDLRKRLQNMCLPTECRICSVKFHSDIPKRAGHYNYDRDHFRRQSDWLHNNGAGALKLKLKPEELTWRAVSRYGLSKQALRWEESCIDLVIQAFKSIHCMSKPGATDTLLTEVTGATGVLYQFRNTMRFVRISLEEGNYAAPSEPASILRQAWSSCDKKDLERKLLEKLNRLFNEGLDEIIKLSTTSELPASTSTSTIKIRDFSPSLPPLFQTTLIMPELGTLNASVFHVSHSQLEGTLFPESASPSPLPIVGRIPPETVWDYIDKRKKRMELIVLRLAPATPEDAAVYERFFNYFASRGRFGVLGGVSSPLKDVYLVPLDKNSAVNPSLLPFHGPGLPIPKRRADCLLAVVTRTIKTESKSKSSRKRLKA